MNYQNITASDVYSEAEAHPYIALTILLACLFIIGMFATCVKTTHNGIVALGWCIYYLLAPIHMPIRWLCNRI